MTTNTTSIAAKNKKIPRPVRPGGLTAGEIRNIGAKAEKMLNEGASVEERTAMAGKEARRAKVDRAKALWANGYSIQEIAEAMGVAESTARNFVQADDEKIDLKSLSTLTLRIREYKRLGLSNVAIGQRVGVSESTVRRRLKFPLTEEETLLEFMMDVLSDSREEILERVIDHELFKTLFGIDVGDAWVLNINTTKRDAGFTRRDGKGQKMSFSLEFSAYRRPTRNDDN